MPIYKARPNDDGTWAVILVNGVSGEVVYGVARGECAQKTAETIAVRLQNGEEIV